MFVTSGVDCTAAEKMVTCAGETTASAVEGGVAGVVGTPSGGGGAVDPPAGGGGTGCDGGLATGLLIG